MAVNNSTVLSRVWLSATNDFQQRISRPTQRDISQFLEDILAPMNNDLWNEFCNILINRIGMQIVHSKRWDNPLAAAFGKGNMLYGNTIQELAPKWLRAHAYQNDVETLLKVHKPDFAQIFHSVNRKEKYVFSFNADEFRAAVADGADGVGINSLLDSLITAQLNSANYDEYIIMKQLIAEYEAKWGFFNVQLSALPSDEATAKEFLKDVRQIASKFRFPSTLYNAGLYEDLPVFEMDPDNIIMLATPETLASVDVDALAAAFNIDRAEIRYRIVEVDEFPIPNTAAILTTRDFYLAYDYVYQTTSFFNPETLNTNYYLHVWQLLSVSPLVPCVRFSTEASTAVPVITETLTKFDIVPYHMNGTLFDTGNDFMPLGVKSTYSLVGKLTGTILDGNSDPAPASFKLAPDSFVIDSIVGFAVDSDDSSIPLEASNDLYVDRHGILHIPEMPYARYHNLDELIAEIATMPYSAIGIHITGHCTYVNPSGVTNHLPDSNSTYPITISMMFDIS